MKGRSGNEMEYSSFELRKKVGRIEETLTFPCDIYES